MDKEKVEKFFAQSETDADWWRGREPWAVALLYGCWLEGREDAAVARRCDALAMAAETRNITGLELWLFLATCAYESAGFRRMEENLNYSPSGLLHTFGSRFTPQERLQYGRREGQEANQRMIANIAYANRIGNRDRDSGDGWAYRGRGFIQLTGKANYEAYGYSTSPDVLLRDGPAAITAARWWGDNVRPGLDLDKPFSRVEKAMHMIGLPTDVALRQMTLATKIVRGSDEGAGRRLTQGLERTLEGGDICAYLWGD